MRNKVQYQPIKVGQPDGTFFISSSKGKVPINNELPQPARIAHSFNNLRTNLMSLGQLCDYGCKATFDKE